jgi:Domain of Unknown Function (DUF1080)
MRSLQFGIVVSCLLAACAVAPGKPADEKKDDFLGGKDLKGWAGLMEFWSNKEGSLVGSTGPDGIKFNTFLCSEKTYKDFELKLQVKLQGKGWTGNSGIQIRSKIRASDEDKKHFAVEGPQCDMGDVYWGSLYGEHFGGMMKQAPADTVKKVLKADDFNDYYIKCVGKHVTIKLNGETTVDEDFEKLPDEGIIAFQLHGGPSMEVTFKNVEFKELKAK